MLDKELIKILVCPRCKKEVVEEKDRLICRNCHKAYPIKDGIPIMLIDQAEDLP